MLITYYHNEADLIPNSFNFEPHIVGVRVVDSPEYVTVYHEKTDHICITVGKHNGHPEQRATISWTNVGTEEGGELEFADKFHHCLETAISIMALVNAHFKKGKSDV